MKLTFFSLLFISSIFYFSTSDYSRFIKAQNTTTYEISASNHTIIKVNALLNIFHHGYSVQKAENCKTKPLTGGYLVDCNYNFNRTYRGKTFIDYSFKSKILEFLPDRTNEDAFSFEGWIPMARPDNGSAIEKELLLVDQIATLHDSHPIQYQISNATNWYSFFENSWLLNKRIDARFFDNEGNYYAASQIIQASQDGNPGFRAFWWQRIKNKNEEGQYQKKAVEYIVPFLRQWNQQIVKEETCFISAYTPFTIDFNCTFLKGPIPPSIQANILVDKETQQMDVSQVLYQMEYWPIAYRNPYIVQPGSFSNYFADFIKNISNITKYPIQELWNQTYKGNGESGAPQRYDVMLKNSTNLGKYYYLIIQTYYNCINQPCITELNGFSFTWINELSIIKTLNTTIVSKFLKVIYGESINWLSSDIRGRDCKNKWHRYNCTYYLKKSSDLPIPIFQGTITPKGNDREKLNQTNIDEIIPLSETIEKYGQQAETVEFPDPEKDNFARVINELCSFRLDQQLALKSRGKTYIGQQDVQKTELFLHDPNYYKKNVHFPVVLIFDKVKLISFYFYGETLISA